jgi:hypothetical protein
MSIHLVPPTALQCGDTIITADNHEWSVKYLDGPDKIGCMDVALIDEAGNQKVEIISDPVRLVM